MNWKFSRCGFLGVAAACNGLSRAGTLKGRGVTISCHPSGPLTSYMPAKVKTVPKTAE